MHYFVLGGTGSIGSVLVPKLLESGNEVTVLGRSDNAVRAIEMMGAIATRGDMTTPDTWLGVASEADVLVQLGSTTTKRSNNRWLVTGGNNNRIAADGLVTAAMMGEPARCVITASGVMVAGDHGNDRIDENTTDRDQLIGRYWGPNEEAVQLARRQGLSATTLRFGQVYDSRPESTFGRFFLTPAAKGRFRYMGDGSNYFPFVHVDDAVSAIIHTAERTPIEKMLYVVEDRVETMTVAIEALMAAFDLPAKSIPSLVGKLAVGKPMATGFMGSYRVDNTLAKKTLDWKPRYPSFREAADVLTSDFNEIVATRADQ